MKMCPKCKKTYAEKGYCPDCVERLVDCQSSGSAGVSSFKKKHVLWKVYFWLSIITLVSTYVTAYLIKYFSIWQTTGMLLVDIIALSGLFCFCWNKRFSKRNFWKFFSILYILYGFLFLLFFTIPKVQQDSHSFLEMVITVSVAILMQLFCYIALWSYAFKDPLWNEPKTIN